MTGNQKIALYLEYCYKFAYETARWLSYLQVLSGNIMADYRSANNRRLTIGRLQISIKKLMSTGGRVRMVHEKMDRTSSVIYVTGIG